MVVSAEAAAGAVPSGVLYTLMVAVNSFLPIIIFVSIIVIFLVRMNDARKENGYQGLLKHILLLLFTFGVWQFVWIYKTTAYLNSTPKEEHRNPTTKLLLCLFVPFYYIYWTYKSAQRIDKLAISRGQQSDISTLCLILSFFISIVPPIIMQEKINNIVNSETNVRIETNSSTTQVTNTSLLTIGVADELKKYKELLDEGIITQEEFDAKKKQLLGI